MGKAKAHPDQMGFDFTAPAPCKGVAELAGLERQINELVGTILNSDPRAREVIAAEMSVLLDDTVRCSTPTPALHGPSTKCRHRGCSRWSR